MQVIIKTLTWTLIHSLWQGLVVALMAAIIISSTRRTKARLRYNLLGIVMILFFLGSVVTFITQWQAETKPLTASSFTATGDTVAIIATSKLMDNFIAWVNTNSETVILAWAFFFLLSCLRLIAGFATVNRLRRYKTHSVTTAWKEKLEQLQLVIGVRQSVSLLQSELVKVPMAIGILKPVIFLPLGLLTHLPAEQVETILLHELAHIRRRDYLVNLLQHAAESIFFFNPAIRWLSSLLRQEREACCDDLVIARCDQKTNYLHALVSFQEYSLNHNTYAMAISCKRHYLLNRIKRMITNKNKGINFFEKLALLAGVLLFSAFSFVTREKEVKSEPVITQPAVAAALPIVAAKAEHPAAKKGKKKKINALYKPVTDTFPVKKDTVPNDKNIPGSKPLPKSIKPDQVVTDANAALQEIVDIKDQIGLKKESIGEKKEQLKTTNGQEKEKILKEIARERDEIEGKRSELKKKRAQWEILRNEALKTSKQEENGGAKATTGNEKSVTIENNKDAGNQEQKTIHHSVDHKTINFQIDNFKLDKQEFQYKVNLQIKDPLPPGWKPVPEKLIKPQPPEKRAWQ
jgi:beta-lactamase regulating signal transducer with metallopeptidase domain